MSSKMFNRVVFFEDHLYVVNPLTGCYLELLGVDSSVTPGEKSLNSRFQVLTPPLRKQEEEEANCPMHFLFLCRSRVNDD